MGIYKSPRYIYYIPTVYNISPRYILQDRKTNLKNEQRNRDAAGKKELIQVEEGKVIIIITTPRAGSRGVQGVRTPPFQPHVYYS